MPTAKYTVESRWKPKNGDAALLVFATKKKQLFDLTAVPADFSGFNAPKDAGKVQVAYAGAFDKVSVVVFTTQLDDKSRRREEILKKVVVEAIGRADSENCKRLVVVCEAGSKGLDRAIHEAAVLGSYKFDKYLKKKAKPVPIVGVFGKTTVEAGKNFRPDAKLLAEVNNARDILNEPGSTANPAGVAATFRRHGIAAGLQIQVWNESKLKKEKCNAILAVGRGAAVKPRMVIGKYGSTRAKKHLVLVGKGLTFDTGGYCIKGGEGM
ncbi:MAG: hypothetical protein E3J72_03390, partial [Planctomycetota bacterium]